MTKLEDAAQDRVKRALISQNGWWSTGHVPESLLQKFRRRDFFVLMQKLDGDRILIIPGPRRAGKTTIMYQMIEELIREKGVDPKRILFVSFDYPYLTSELKRPFEDILRMYTETVLKESLDGLTDRVYIFIDEVYSLADWGQILKGHFDRKTNTKIIATGSSSPQIMEGAARALIGRIDKHLMLQMKFVDVATYNMGKSHDEIKEASLGILRGGFQEALEEGKAKKLLESYGDGYNALAHLEDEFQGQLLEYLIKDGYPENLAQADYSKCAQSIAIAVDFSIYKDVMRIFRDREPDSILRLMALLSQSSGNVVGSRTLATTLGMNLRTIEKYLWHLESVYLVSLSYAFSGSVYRSLPKARKIYIANVGARNAMMGLLSERLKENSTELGKCAEMVALDHIKRLAFCLEPSKETKTFYWRDSKGNEVDIIAEMKGNIVPFDVRFRETIDDKDLRALKLFLEENPKCRFGVLLTKRSMGIQGNIVMIPLWLFLLT